MAAGTMNNVSNKQYKIVGSKEAKETRLGFNPIISMPTAKTDVAMYIKDIYVHESKPLFLKKINVNILKYIAGI
ncbi:MAG: hypothetical protein U0K66_05895 [Paludibacteraceae bacterium]|jgi:hypothetical protein|nr:hypothetical protein [Paludibacteraceae bacterium]